ncbi:PREDICTED: chlorophyllase-1-like [Nelumbo nucifera]|uniref:Chlorophyllase-1-like n=1 Tax=Nelumbo nucifera TaxID=4432 RepID=A0A1U8Q555_NELNU|nr:PREDICTED: chlorophyllase-1-like [Nelumbo nucifera]
MALLEVNLPTAAATTTGVFETGKFSVGVKDTVCSPKPLRIVSPTESGKYPVLLFLHGTALSNVFYTQLLTHIASHGFICVAPQLPFGEEICCAALVTNWFSEGLKSVIPGEAQPNLQKLALVGHSRGGKAAFALALGLAPTSLAFSVLIGLDPVAGKCKGCECPPKILTYQPRSFNLGIPVMVIGTGLGEKRKIKLFCPCAPPQVSHQEFYDESKHPRYHMVTADYGHMDMLDDNCKGILGTLSSSLCKSGDGDKDLMRRCVGGIIVAFMREYLEVSTGDLKGILDAPEIAPVKLDPVEYDEA